MRILQLTDTLTTGGSERMSVNISNALSADGHHVVLCASRAGGELEAAVAENVLFELLNKRSVFDVSAFIRLLRMVKANRIEIVHAHATSQFWAVLLKLFVRGLKIVWHDHEGMSEAMKASHRRGVRLLSNWVDATIVVNELLLEWNMKHSHTDKQRIIMINNFPALPDQVSQHQRRPDRMNILCLADLRDQKDHVTLLRATRRGIDLYRWEHVQLLIAGRYWKNDYFSTVEAAIDELDLREVVRMLGPVEHVGELLRDTDMGVLSSMSEGLSVSLLEYGLAGLPVVVTAVGQTAEVVDQGSCGWLVKSGDVNAFAAAMNEVISDPDGARLKGERLRERVHREYGAGNFLKAYYALLARCGIPGSENLKDSNRN